MSRDDDALSLEPGALPAGVTPRAWREERARWQNPRIRTLLGCAKILEYASESNQAILACSPDRLAEIWASVRQVARMLCDEFIPLLEGPSVVPKLDEARQRTRAAAAVLYSTVIGDIQQMPEHVEEARAKEFRRLLCVSLGHLEGFLQNALLELVANDPRSSHDTGYFLSRRFRRDVEEGEWLLETLDSVIAQLEVVEGRRQRDLSAFLRRLAAGDALAECGEQDAVGELLRDLVSGLTPRLKEVTSLRGIRIEELELIDRWATELPVRCHLVLELLSLARGTGGAAGETWATAIPTRVHILLTELDGVLKDLRAFLPVWRRGVYQRRALAFRRPEGGELG